MGVSEDRDNDLSDLGNPGAVRGAGLAGLLGDDDEDDFVPTSTSQPSTAVGFRPEAGEPSRTSAGSGPSRGDTTKRTSGTDTLANDTPADSTSATESRRPRSQTASESGNAKTLYTSDEVKTRLTNYRFEHRISALKIILQAIEHAAGGGENLRNGDLDELRKVLDEARVKGDLDFFAENPNTVKYKGGGSTPSQYRPTPAQFKQLQQLTVLLGFTERSTWLAPVLDNFLPADQAQPRKRGTGRGKGTGGGSEG